MGGGTTNVSLPVQDVRVTAVKPTIAGSNERPGFFVQAGTVGLFVEVDPASVAPPPRIGDRVSFTVTQVVRSGNQRKASAIGSWLLFENAPIGPLVRSLTGVDLSMPTTRTQYESTVVSFSSAVQSWSTDGGYGNVALGASAYSLRMPVSLNDTQDLRSGCSVTATASPLVLNFTPQVYVWDAGSLVGTTCPPPQFLSVTPDAGTALLTFSRYLDPTSVMASSFMLRDLNGPAMTPFSGTVSLVDRERVMLSSGSSFTAGTEYELMANVRDTRGAPLALPNKLSFVAGGCRGGDVIISAVSFGLGSQWVELHNRSSAAVNMNNRNLVLFEQNRPNNESLSGLGSLQAGQFALVRLSGLLGVPYDLNLGSIMLEQNSGGVAVFATGSGTSCLNNPALLDAVSWGTNSSNACTESGSIVNAGGSVLVRRDLTRGCRDSNNNQADFVVSNFYNPRNRNAQAVTCLCP